jgi:NAD(P)-dependent dehydrogenase (short-subunit alcohol dehydrogenase family)
MLKKSKSPSVINVTSLNAELAFPNNPAYVASKSALAGLTRSMALDYGKHGIRVNAIAPGYIKTDMTGESWTNLEKRKKRAGRTVLNRWGTPEDLAGPLLFLASEMSSYVSGHSLFVDGGWRIRGL